MPEDASHIWICQGPGVENIWNASLHSLDQWMESVDTDPNISAAMLLFLRSWRSDSYLAYNPPFLRRHQATIGHWIEFDFGRMTSKRVGSCATGMLQSNKVQKIRKVMDRVYYIETMAGSMGFMGS
jgi:hypothetical protein